MERTPVIAALEGGVLTLMLNRPQRLNAMNNALIEAMNHELARARDDADIRCVLLTGLGRGFCAGADLAGGGTVDSTANVAPDLGANMDRIFNPMIRAMRELPKPIVGAINGVAAGGGANFALACDIVLAARSARFDQAFVRISLMPDLGGTWFLPRTVGDARARGLAMLGKSVPAEEAERMGMIWQTVDDDALMAEATKLARQLAGGPTLSYAAIKQAINAAATNTLDQQLDLERDSQRALGRSADFKEGVSAFLAKRPAAVHGTLETMSYNTITVAHDQGLATLTLNAPDKLNAVSRKMIAELKDCWETLAADASVRAVLLTGAGRGFCAGADLSDPDRDSGETADSGSALDKFFNPVIRLMRSLPKPIVAAVNGAAAGVGMSFALAADIAIAGKSASFLQAFARIGLLPDGGSTWFLPRLVGEQRARALAMLAPKISAEQAKEWGLIWDVVEDGELMKTATEVARGLADGPTLSLARIKEAMNRASGNHAQPAARPRARLPARARPQRGFQGRRSGLPRQAQAQLQGQVGGSMTTPHKEITSGLKFPEGPDRHARRLGDPGRDRAPDADPRHARRQAARDRQARRRSQRRGHGARRARST